MRISLLWTTFAKQDWDIGWSYPKSAPRGIYVTVRHWLRKTSLSVSRKLPLLLFALRSVIYFLSVWKKKPLTNYFFFAAAVKALDTVKDQLLRKHFPNIQRSAVLAGFHRGRRHFHGPIMFPDIVSIHHLHLHIIIEPFKTLALFKYPSWFRFMWISDQAIMEQVKGRKRIESEPESRPSEPGCSADEAGAWCWTSALGEFL